MQEVLSSRRQLKRYQLNHLIDVVDCHSKYPLGRLVNIHAEGLMIIGPALTLHAAYQIQLQLPCSINQSHQIEVGIECLWQQQLTEWTDRQTYWSGTQIIDCSPNAKKSIIALINSQTQ